MKGKLMDELTREDIINAILLGLDKNTDVLSAHPDMNGVLVVRMMDDRRYHVEVHTEITEV